jgi:hypothetical protein
VVQADFEVPYKDGVSIPDPVYGDNCPDPELTWEMTDPLGTTTYGNTDPSGINLIPNPSRYSLGVTTITYTITDTSNNSVSCSFTVTVLGKPDITCLLPVTYDTDPGVCSHAVLPGDPDNPGVPVLNSGLQPIDWTWTITNPDGSFGPTGSSTTTDASPIPPPPGPYSFQKGTSTILWHAENISGFSECTQDVIVEDHEPPTFASAPIENCVLRIIDATFDPPSGNIIPSRPDYWVMVSGDGALDLDPGQFSDNCTLNCTPPDAVEIRWIVTMNDGTTVPATDPYFVGQPSTYGTDIPFLGDGVTFGNVVHTITYWIVDCAGNVSDPQTETITITPRPNIIKLN